MFPFSHDPLSNVVVAGAFVALTAVSIPARADDLVQNLGPVGPHQPILTTVGSKRVIAFYTPGSDRCSLHAVVWDNTGPAGSLAARVRISLEPGQIVQIDTAQDGSLKTLNLGCGDNADKLAILDSDSPVASDTTIQPKGQPLKASVSGF
jgi:hypothetical protein